MHEVTVTHWCWIVGLGAFSLLMLFLAAEGMIKGKLSAPSIVMAGFLITLAAVTMSFFLSCVGDVQEGQLDTFHAMERGWKHFSLFFRQL
jgi:hypothetical protein